MNQTRNEVVGLTPGLAQWVKDPALLWLWHRHRQAAIAQIRLLAWKPPHDAGVALKRQKKKKKKKKTKTPKKQN